MHNWIRKLKHWRLRPYSNTWQTTLWVMLVVMLSVSVSLWFFWRSLYLPELRNHAHYLATELQMLTNAQTKWQDNPQVKQWLYDNSHLSVVDNPKDFPEVEDKTIAEFFTDILAEEISQQTGHDVVVYFKFKPTPQLWIHDSQHPELWVREPVIYYAQYSLSSLGFFLLGIPIFSLLTILLLVRQLNRPLRKLQRAATNYIQMGHATALPTRTGSIEIRQVNTAFNRLFTTLSQAQKERTIMLAGISHDLRTPLTRMRLTAEMLPDDFFREGLIYDIEDMDAILEQFISFMKDGSDEPVRLTDLDAIFKEVIVQFAPLEFIYDAQPLELVPVRPLSIKRLIINLVNNANRYGKPPIYLSANISATDKVTEHTEIENSDPNLDTNTLEVTTTMQPQSEKTLTICIRDCGEGVADEHLQRIMQPFERGESARTTQGSGLGLAIVSRIAKLHHGSVEAINHPSGGLQVCVRIPLLAKAVTKIKPPATEEDDD
ncbi:ATP-binding protein [Psychrobacter sp. I-STPA6b]|uniref:ATP-binding protein n=1 Tax=Psychrobacter sp. I-STPA6b TaxID=2585718 RepID=UPI001D0CC132|nr:ATP-binding protein [Psychrobacter sp. I-STPA6b]